MLKLNKLALDQNTFTNKNFDELNGELTLIENELEKKTKCSLNYYLRNIKKKQIGSQQTFLHSINNINAIGTARKDDDIEERLKNMGKKYQNYEKEMKIKFKTLELSIEKVRASTVPRIDNISQQDIDK